MKFSVSPMTCGSCVRRITEALRGIDPAARVEVDMAAGSVEAAGGFDAAAVVAALAGLGYRAVPAGADAVPASTAGCCGTCTV